MNGKMTKTTGQASMLQQTAAACYAWRVDHTSLSDFALRHNISKTTVCKFEHGKLFSEQVLLCYIADGFPVDELADELRRLYHDVEG